MYGEARSALVWMLYGIKGWMLGILSKGWGAASEALSLQQTYVNMYLGSVCRMCSLSVMRDVYDFHVTPGNRRNAYYVCVAHRDGSCGTGVLLTW